MDPVAIHFTEDLGLVRRGEVVRFGVPLKRGNASPTSQFFLSDPETGNAESCHASATAHWADGSPRWLEICAVVDMEPWEKLTLHLVARDTRAPGSASSPSVQMHRTSSDWQINAGALSVRLVTNEFCWVVAQDSKNCQLKVKHEILLTDDSGGECRAVLDSPWSPVQRSDRMLILQSRGRWRRTDDSLVARMTCRLYFFAGSDTIGVETCLHNPNRSRHPGGLWDLGDAGSVHFKSLEIRVCQPDSDSSSVKPEVLREPVSVPAGDALQLYQDSSGGKYWASRNHIDADGNRTVNFRGYQLRVGSTAITRGERATPIASLIGPSGSVHASVNQFWQNFPTALSVQGDRLAIELFPDGFAKPYELQGGERKTQTAYLNYGADPDALLWTQAPLVPVVEPRHYEHAGAFPWFRAGMDSGPLDVLIRRGLDGPENFFAKREVIDEFGWRNFGDVFADHETHYQKPGETPLISHYNNQYDAIYGFARQFALTGDRRWYELMDDLARHVTDIDIYHTDEDRAEYNGGLFWHTDHYLDAHTATHRTFTRHNTTSSTPGQTGGGPASEHCYTTGLLYHYYLTGAEASRDAILQLANWMVAAHEGRGGLLEQLLALKKHEIPKLKLMLRGTSVMPHRYPFTRGTGNYLNALLDAWLLEPGGPWLARTESVIFDAIHPDDDIEQRDLLNVETGWSYLILLASIARYLALKEEVSEKDGPYRYALESFLRYADWMRENERPFLTEPDQLEFANDTWVAQDVRKAMLMFQAASYETSRSDAYHAKGQEWLDYVCERLETSPEAGYARIQIILLQNYGPQHLEPAMKAVPDGLDLAGAGQQPVLTWRMLAGRVARRLGRGLRTFNPGREKAWLNARLDRS